MLMTFALLTGLAAAQPRPLTACQVLTPRDVRRVQGARYTDTRLTESKSGDVTVSQCFYRLEHFTDSITVDLIRGDAREFWDKHFGEVKPVRNGEEEEHESEATAVSGIGEKAVWSGNRMSGALYVLSGDTIVRVSVGGAGSQQLKIEKAKKLAARVVQKL